jgi:transposase
VTAKSSTRGWRWRRSKGQKTAAELASEYEAHVSKINAWNMPALEALPEVFGRGEAREEAQREAERDRLYRQTDLG